MSLLPSWPISPTILQVRPNILELNLDRKRKVNPHYLESYRTALQAAMLLQFTRRGTPQGRAGILALGQQPALRAICAAEGYEPYCSSSSSMSIVHSVGMSAARGFLFTCWSTQADGVGAQSTRTVPAQLSSLEVSHCWAKQAIQAGTDRP